MNPCYRLLEQPYIFYREPYFPMELLFCPREGLWKLRPADMLEGS